MHRFFILRPAAVAMAAVLASPTAALASPEAPTVRVAIETDRLVFPDNLYPGQFVVSGACLSSTSEVVVTRRVCQDPSGDDVSEGMLRTATLGFTVHRRVEAIPADAPVLQTNQGAAPEQLVAVHLDLRVGGDLTVRVTGRKSGPVDPSPVAGSASGGGTISGASVVWTLGEATPGTYDFSVRFRPGAPTGFDGSFTPEVAVELATLSPKLLEFGGGSVPAPVDADRVSALTMRQLVAPGYGPPTLSATGYTPAMAGAPGPNSWEVVTSLDGRGAYQPDVSGALSIEAVGPFDELAPGATGVVNTAWSGGSYWGSPLIVDGQTKGISTGDFDFTPDGKPSGFRVGLQTATALSLFPLPFGPLATGGSIWDNDVFIVGRAAGIHTVKGETDREPAGSQGILRADWQGERVFPWSGTWANYAPGGEPNALNHNAYLYNGSLVSSGLNYGYRSLYQTAATIPMEVVGGDIDNRSGSSNIEGEPVSFQVPAGQRVSTVDWLTVRLPATNYDMSFQWNADFTGFTMTPYIGPGGYWLESSRDGYDRDWSNVTAVRIAAKDESPNGPSGVGTAGSVLVPTGATAVLHVLDVDTAIERTVTLTPGSWSYNYSPRLSDIAVMRLPDAG